VSYRIAEQLNCTSLNEKKQKCLNCKKSIFKEFEIVGYTTLESSIYPQNCTPNLVKESVQKQK
jgi:hypothetical protein